MASTPFSIASNNPEISYGPLDADGTGLMNGYLAKWSSGELVLADGIGITAVGLLYSTKQELLPEDRRAQTDVNDITDMKGKNVGLITGDVTVVVGSGHFESVSGIALGDGITASNSAPGKYKIAASTNLVLGRVINITSDQYDTALYAVRFSFPSNQVVA